MLTVFLQGGLGNQLFQLAALESIASASGVPMFLEDEETPKTHHSKRDYFQSVFLEWKQVQRMRCPVQLVNEPSFEFRSWTISGPSKLQGYFQNYKYVSDSFLESLWLPNVPVLDGAFLHIRGGDFVNHWLHHIDLRMYYERAVQMFPPDTKFYVFTNDIAYAKTLSFLENIPHSFVEEPDEVRAIARMKNCKAGGICANSTFSWWGAFLNRNNRTLVLPSKWYNDASIYIDGYFFPEAIRCPVEES